MGGRQPENIMPQPRLLPVRGMKIQTTLMSKMRICGNVSGYGSVSS